MTRSSPSPSHRASHQGSSYGRRNEANRTRWLDQPPSPVTQIHRPARLATRAASFRYGGRHHSGIPGDIIPLYPGDFVGIRTQGPPIAARAPIGDPNLDNCASRWHQSRTEFQPAGPLMKQFLLKFFTWWNGQTFGTQLWTWRFGELVGTDEQGNRYYRTIGRKNDPTLGFERRWVIYNGYAQASRLPPDLHGLLDHTVGVAPADDSHTPPECEKPHSP